RGTAGFFGVEALWSAAIDRRFGTHSMSRGRSGTKGQRLRGPTGISATRLADPARGAGLAIAGVPSPKAVTSHSTPWSAAIDRRFGTHSMARGRSGTKGQRLRGPTGNSATRLSDPAWGAFLAFASVPSPKAVTSHSTPWSAVIHRRFKTTPLRNVTPPP